MVFGLFYEYVITPEVFDPVFLSRNGAHAVILTQLLRGICKDGMISDLHKNGWSRDIKQRIVDVRSQKLKTDLTTLLSVLKDRNRLVRHPKGSDNPKDNLKWLELAREAHDRAPLDAIILTPELLKLSKMNDEILVEFDGALDSPAWLSRRQSKTIKQQKEDYLGLFPKFLRHAKRLYLIDPYFSPKRKWTDTIKICASLMGQRGGEPLKGSIEIHTGYPSKRSRQRSPQNEGTKWKSWKKNEFYPNFQHTLSVEMWEGFEDGERMHDRFLITDQVGFSIAGGLDCLQPPFASDTIFTLMDEEDRQLWLNKFRTGTSPYKKIEL